MPQAKVLVRGITLRDREGHETLVVEFAIACDLCGGLEGAINGHHLRTIHAALGKIIEQRPTLCGEAGDVVDTLEFSGSDERSKKAGMN